MPEWLKGTDCKSVVGNGYVGSNPTLATRKKCGNSSIGRAAAFQAVGCGFESRFPLQKLLGEIIAQVFGERFMTSVKE